MKKEKFEIVEVKNTSSGEILTEKCIGYISDVVEFYSLKKPDGCYRIHKIKRLKDNVLFCVGDNVFADNGWGYRVIGKFQYDDTRYDGILVYFTDETTGLQILDGLTNTNKIQQPTEIVINGIEYLLTPKQK